MNQLVNSIQKVKKISLENDSETALMHARKAAEAICKSIFSQVYKSHPGKLTIEQYIIKLGHDNHIIPDQILIALRTIQNYGNLASHSNEDIELNVLSPVLDSLSIMIFWYFEEFKKSNVPQEIIIGSDILTENDRFFNQSERITDKELKYERSVFKDEFSKIEHLDENLIGKTIQNYRLVSKIGEGGYGKVYKAIHKRDSKEVVVKISHLLPYFDDKQTMENYKELLLSNTHGLLALNHPYIVKYIDFGEYKTNRIKNLILSNINLRFFYILEYIEGESLSKKLRIVNNKAELRMVVKLFIKICEGINAAHQTKYLDKFNKEVVGIIHGDIKPENIILSFNGEPKITDFLQLDILNLAKLAEQLRHSTQTMGTAGYMAPEQESEGILSQSSDVFSLGILLLEMLAGKILPFKQRIPEMEYIEFVNYTNKLNPFIAKWIYRIIFTATRRNKKDRYKTVQEMIKDFKWHTLFY